jgi:hypothetical protein
MLLSYRDIRVRRERNQLIRDALERGDSPDLLIVVLAAFEQASELKRVTITRGCEHYY